MDYAQKLKKQFRIGDLDLPEGRKRYISNTEEQDTMKACPYGKAGESRTHIIEECELCRDEREALEEQTRNIGCGMAKFSAFGKSAKKIAMSGDKWMATRGQTG